MELNLKGLKEKYPEVFGELPSAIFALGENNFLTFFYLYDDASSKIIDIQKVSVVPKITLELYKDMPYTVIGTPYSLGYFKLPFDSQSMLFYQFISYYCNNKQAIKVFYDGLIYSDIASIQRKKENAEYHNVFNIFTREIFKESVDRFIIAEEVRIPVMTICDSIDSHLKQTQKKSLYGQTISKVVMAIRNPNGGLIPEESGKLRYLYVGEKATQSIGDGTLVEAKEMLRNKFTAGEIYAKTSWFFNRYDNKWRKQMSDVNVEIPKLKGNTLFMKVDSKFSGRYNEIMGYVVGGNITANKLSELASSGWDTYLSDVLKHPTLYKNYPELFKMPVFFATNDLPLNDDTYQFYFSSDGMFMVIYGNPLDWDLKTVMLHETQHAIQNIEGFATGGNIFIANMIQAVGGAKIKPFFYLRKQIQDLYKSGATINGDYSHEKYLVLIDKINDTLGQKLIDAISEKEYYRTYKDISQTLLIYSRGTHKGITELISQFLKQKIVDASKEIDKMCEYASTASQKMMAQGLNKRQVKKVLFETYEALAGEVEARDTQHTSQMEDSLRGYLLPMTSESVDSEKVTVIIDDFISDGEPIQAKIKAGVEKVEDGKYVIHLLETMSSEPLLHELGHIVSDILGSLVFERITGAFNQDTIDEFGGVGEIFCEQFLSYLHRQNISEDLNYDISSRTIEDKQLFDEELKAIFYIKSDQDQDKKLMDMLSFISKLNEAVYENNGPEVSPLVKYEEDVFAFMEELGEMSRSDAQGVADQYAEFIKASLIAGASARKTALKILEKSEIPRLLTGLDKLEGEISDGIGKLKDILGDTFSGMPEIDVEEKAEVPKKVKVEVEVEEKPIDLNTKEGILKSSTIEGNVVKLPPGNLDRKLYMEVKNALELIGGKWVGGKTMGFVFNEDPTELLAQISGGEKRNLKKEFQFFATPDSLSDEVVQLANIQPTDKVLEPSAGQGAIVKAVHRKNPDIVIDYCEFMPSNQIFMKRLPNVNMVGDDFLALPLSFQYDKIVANPPFAKNQDITHVQKMYQHLKPGGRLVAITSQHWKHSSNKKETEFRNWLTEVGAVIKEISAGTFKESGTSTATMVLVIDKKESKKNELPPFIDKIKGMFKENKWHFINEKVNGHDIKMKFFIGVKEIDVQIFTIDNLTYGLSGNYMGKRETLNQLIEKFNTKLV